MTDSKVSGSGIKSSSQRSASMSPVSSDTMSVGAQPMVSGRNAMMAITAHMKCETPEIMELSLSQNSSPLVSDSKPIKSSATNPFEQGTFLGHLKYTPAVNTVNIQKTSRLFQTAGPKSLSSLSSISSPKTN
ncbi:MAG: hypothetical protein UX09_C0017G0015 [Candidatus Uhrbacteria bacterium GW2011_GWE2_45_35]|uniref:Uncharacterized protein n=2 Tax=Candidatus Uhriibacteriota TaxID=1752732 RepID=A0A0G1LS34_9BACT|nr:MAG: hypothetical protein UW63_C0011G0003 [Candidatus Uhrbacteria bacterium GW2011_GWF2_44_350]KKU08457.1 MAG: hypothetical protein UX09_C0017G0015 [Candidatus Uhrbacteria bacterium GW2011_GWE2_45_35]